MESFLNGFILIFLHMVKDLKDEFQLQGSSFSFASVKFSKASLQFRPKVSNQALHRPSSAVSQSADGMTFNLLCQLPKQINFLRLCIALNWEKRRRDEQ